MGWNIRVTSRYSNTTAARVVGNLKVTKKAYRYGGAAAIHFVPGTQEYVT